MTIANMSEEKINCWEYKECGRAPGGNRVDELGVCPAATIEALHGVHGGTNGGRACWALAGTLCDRMIHGDFFDKFKNCIRCEFFQYVEKQENSRLVGVDLLLQRIKGPGVEHGQVRPADSDRPLLAVKCDCDQQLLLPADENWQINIVGLIEFRCRKCNRIYRTPGLFNEDADRQKVTVWGV